MRYGKFCRKDDGWRLSRGVYVFVSIGLLLLLGAISAVTVVVKPWSVRLTLVFAAYFRLKLKCTFLTWCLFLFNWKQIGVAFLLVLLMMVLAIGAIHHWASNNFYLTRTQMFFVCFLASLLALAAFLVGWFEGEKQNPLPPNIILLPPHCHSFLAKNIMMLLMTFPF